MLKVWLSILAKILSPWHGACSRMGESSDDAFARMGASGASGAANVAVRSGTTSPQAV